MGITSETALFIGSRRNLHPAHRKVKPDEQPGSHHYRRQGNRRRTCPHRRFSPPAWGWTVGAQCAFADCLAGQESIGLLHGGEHARSPPGLPTNLRGLRSPKKMPLPQIQRLNSSLIHESFRHAQSRPLLPSRYWIRRVHLPCPGAISRTRVGPLHHGRIVHSRSDHQRRPANPPRGEANGTPL